MSEINTLFDLVDKVGFDRVDDEIGTWILMGEFDEYVRERARELNWVPPDTPYSELDKPLF